MHFPRVLWISPVLLCQSGAPFIVSRVADDEDATCFKGSRCDDQVRITTRVSAATGDDPGHFDTIQDAVCDWNDGRMPAEVFESCQLIGSTNVLESSGDLKPSESRECKLAMRSQVVNRYGNDVRVSLFQDLR